jgi:hypothetical protein
MDFDSYWKKERLRSLFTPEFGMNGLAAASRIALPQ